MTRVEKFNSINSTNYRIVMSSTATAVCVVLACVAVFFFDFEPSDAQTKFLYGVAALLALAMGFDVSQFIGKRFSDVGYAAAKSGATVVGRADAVNVDTTSDSTAIRGALDDFAARQRESGARREQSPSPMVGLGSEIEDGPDRGERGAD